MLAMTIDRLLPRVPLLHALYLVPPSLVGLLNRRAFEAVTGPKSDYWLVRTVSGLLIVIGIAVASADLRDRITPENAASAIGSSAVLTVIDVAYVGRRRILPVYLLVALGNLLLIGGWVIAVKRGAVSLGSSDSPR